MMKKHKQIDNVNLSSKWGLHYTVFSTFELDDHARIKVWSKMGIQLAYTLSWICEELMKKTKYD